VAQPGARPRAAGVRAPLWVLLLFWLGAVIVLLAAVVYGVAAAFPDLGAQPGEAARVRAFAGVVAGFLALLFAGQVLAATGLTAGWSWARPLATVVCVVWALSCLGLPVALLVLNSLWRGRRPAAAPSPWP
jgi:hypothetical protein